MLPVELPEVGQVLLWQFLTDSPQVLQLLVLVLNTGEKRVSSGQRFHCPAHPPPPFCRQEVDKVVFKLAVALNDTAVVPQDALKAAARKEQHWEV